MSDRRGWLALSACLLIAVGAYWIWFTRWDIYTWGDWGFHFNETAREFLDTPQVWSPSSLGGVDISLPLYPIVRLLVGLLSQAMPAFQALHIIYLLPSVFLSAISGFVLARYVHKSNTSGLIGSFIFTFNTYFLIIRGGHLPLVNAFALAPLALVFFLHGLTTSRVYFFVLAGVIGSISTAYEVRGAYLLFGLLSALAVIYSPIITRRTLAKSAVTLAVFLVLNLYWIFGLFLTGGAAGLPIFHRTLYGEGYAHLVRSMVLQLHQWSPSGLIGPGIQPTPVYLWIIPFLAFLELYLGRKNRLIVFFGLVALAGIFFSKMAGQPFPRIYEWMFNHFPGFGIFREPSKFFFLTAIGYSVLLSGFVNRAWSGKVKVFIFSLISALFLINARGVISGRLGDLLVPRTIPPDYLVLKDFILSQPEFFRTFYLPYISRWGIWTNSHPVVSGLTLVQSDWFALNNYTQTGLNYSYSKEVSHIFTKEFSDRLLDMASIKYVIVPLQDQANNDDLFAIYGPRNEFLQLAQSLPYLTPRDIGTDQIAVFENIGYLPHFYLTSQPNSIYELSPQTHAVSSNRISSTQYQIQLGPVSETTYINFTDLYHPGWKISPGQVSWFDVILGRQAFLPDSDHTKNTAQLNTFKITPSPQTETFGVYTIYFQPQAYLNLGLIFSIAGAVTIISYLLITTPKFLHG